MKREEIKKSIVAALRKNKKKKFSYNENGESLMDENEKKRDAVLTVIMPVYNGEETIAQALDSIVTQETEYKFKLLIINDGSTYFTEHIIEEYKNKYDFIEVVQNENNIGYCEINRQAYRLIKTPYFCFLDADDYWTNKKKIQNALDLLQKNPDISCYAENYMLLYSDNRMEVAIQTDIDSKDFGLLCEMPFFQTSTTIFRNNFCSIILDQMEKFHPLEGDNFRNFWAIMNGKIHFENVTGSVRRMWNGIYTDTDFYYQRLINAHTAMVLADFAINSIDIKDKRKMGNIVFQIEQSRRYLNWAIDNFDNKKEQRYSRFFCEVFKVKPDDNCDWELIIRVMHEQERVNNLLHAFLMMML